MRLLGYVVIIFIILGYSYGASAESESQIVEWGNAPLACLPDRSEKWPVKESPVPCHCPPQELFCPNSSGIGLENIYFDVTISTAYLTGSNLIYTKINAADVKEIPDDVQKIFKISENKTGLLKIIAPNIQPAVDKYINSHKQTGGCGGNFSVAGFAVVGQGRCGKPGGHIIGISIEITLDGGTQDIDGWLNGFLMPPEMVSRWCDGGLCPTGTVLKEEVKTIEREFCHEERLTEEEIAALEAENNNTDDGDAANNGDTSDNGDDADNSNDADDGDNADAEIAGDNDLNDVDEACCDEGQEIPTKTVCETRNIEITTYSCKFFRSYPREGCLLEGTQVMLQDGSEVVIEKLDVGDKLMGKLGSVTITAINKFKQDRDTVYGINGGKAFFTEEHPILTKKGWKSVKPAMTKVVSGITVGPLVIGDVIITKKGEYITVKTIDKKPIKNGATVYNLKVKGEDGAFTANGIIVKGFDKVQIQY